MKRLNAALAVIAILLPVAGQAQNRNCGPMEVVAGTLSKKYGEAPVAIGLAKNGALLEIWGNAETQTWTITTTTPKKQMCLIASGDALEILSWPDNSLDL